MNHIYCPFEFKADSNDNTGTFVGYGSTFGNVDTYGDTVAKGAFKQTIQDAKSGATNWPVMLSVAAEGLTRSGSVGTASSHPPSSRHFTGSSSR
jgi:Caudovirus prohead serine protease